MMDIQELEGLFIEALFEVPCCYPVDYYHYPIDDEIFAHAVFAVTTHDDSELYEIDLWLGHLLTLPDEWSEWITEHFEHRIRDAADLYEDLA